MALPMRRFTLITIIVLFGLIAAATVYQIVLVGGKPRTFAGPGLSPTAGQLIVGNLVGRDREDAERLLDEAGLPFRVDARGDPGEGGSDLVLAQDPTAGTLVDDDHVVSLTVDCFPAPCPAPPEGETIVDPCGCVSR